MKKYILVVILLCCTPAFAQQKSNAWQQAEKEAAAGKYKEAFEHLRDFEHAVLTNPNLDDKGKAAERYKAARTRMSMYFRMRRPANALEHLEKMENLANASGDEALRSDYLYNKTIYYVKAKVQDTVSCKETFCYRKSLIS